MGCCTSSPHSRRQYRDPADLDECVVPEDQLPLHRGGQGDGLLLPVGRLRTFGRYRPNSVWVPDDIDGLPSTHMDDGVHLASAPDTLLYSAEIDNGRACRCIRPLHLMWCFPPAWPFLAGYLCSQGIGFLTTSCACEEACCWVRKSYMTRNFFRVYPNRIEVNNVTGRFFGLCGCGSWNADDIIAHPFDRGAFGFRPVRCGAIAKMCCLFPVYGGVVARQRCQCNGPLWYGCDGWWCDEWCCSIFFCSYQYQNLHDAEETAMAASLALQAYFEGRKITRDDMDKCLDYWRDNVSERHDPVGRKRNVCCEQFSLPCLCTGKECYRYCANPKRVPPYATVENESDELEKVYKDYEERRQRQIEFYDTYISKVHVNTCCQAMGCRRFWGRRGVVFCTEGCCNCCCCSDIKRQPGDPYPPVADRDLDDDNCASTILGKVLGSPPPNVKYLEWEPSGVGAGQGYEIVSYPRTHGRSAVARTTKGQQLTGNGSQGSE
mmetsp:Transcript_33374/g.73199  ORF Transcript_33374/g.73199 Transcript_33374/m.73199 type:complete len:491 (+) Transcript_33374:59-1531(+)